MSDLEQNLKTEFQDSDYRYAYAESFLNTKLATQIKTLREQRGETQARVAELMGIKQPGYRRYEDVNHSVWKTDTLWDIARAYGVRLNISFETFGSLLEEKKNFTKDALKRPEFKDDPAFKEPPEEPEKVAANLSAQSVYMSAALAHFTPVGLFGVNPLGLSGYGIELGVPLIATDPSNPYGMYSSVITPEARKQQGVVRLVDESLLSTPAPSGKRISIPLSTEVFADAA